MKVRVGRVVLAQIGLSVLALLAFTLSFASPSAAAPPLDRLISITIQSDIIGYYASALNRAPDQWGYNIHVHNAANNCNSRLGNVGSTVYNSPEFLARPLSNEQRVKALYFGLLNRAVDSSGLQFYAGQLNLGMSWAWAVNAVASSSEYGGRVAFICHVHFTSGNIYFIAEANGLLNLPFFDNAEEFVRQRELRRQAANPYNWTTDGCSGPTPDAWLLFDYRVCWRHDWGWRNYGAGLTMNRTESQRQLIDDVFHNDMHESCDRRWGSGLTWQLCSADANAFYHIL